MNSHLRKNAFTLVELLVVIAIIASLLSILVPSLARARSQAKRTLCQIRLKQWGYAFQMYAQNNNNLYPHSDGRDRTGDYTENDLLNPLDKIDYYYGWVDVLPPLFDEKPWREHQLYNFPQSDTIYQCASAKPLDDSQYAYKPTRNGFFSFAMNSCLELDDNCKWYESAGCTTPMPSFLKTTSIKNPQKVILLFDQLLNPKFGYDGKFTNKKAGQYCGAYPREFSARHKKGKDTLGGSILFTDYHIEFRDTVWKKDWPADLYVPPRNDTEWFPYPQ